MRRNSGGRSRWPGISSDITRRARIEKRAGGGLKRIPRSVPVIGEFQSRCIVIVGFNKTYRRSGTLWEGRYKSTLVDSDSYCLLVSRYIELNPVRAGMVRSPGEYPWSSYHANAGARHDRLLTPHPVYRALGVTAQSRQSAYRALCEGEIGKEILDEIRYCTNQAWALGSDKFKGQIRDAANRRTESKGWGGDRRSRSLGL